MIPNLVHMIRQLNDRAGAVHTPTKPSLTLLSRKDDPLRPPVTEIPRTEFNILSWYGEQNISIHCTIQSSSGLTWLCLPVIWIFPLNASHMTEGTIVKVSFGCLHSPYFKFPNKRFVRYQICGCARSLALWSLYKLTRWQRLSTLL